MTRRSQLSLLFSATVFTVAAVACGGGSSSVTGPELPATAGAVPSGATIAGTVQSPTAATGDVAASSVSGLRVSVTGTALETRTDGSGRFTLTGVPTGRVELRFEGDGIDARLEIEGLESGQTLTLTVRVSGSSASRVEDGDDDGDDDSDDDDDDDDDQHGQDVEFEGTITGTSPLVVSGRTVSTNASTRYLGRNNESLSASQVLVVGNRVEVEGHLQDGAVLAKKIKLED